MKLKQLSIKWKLFGYLAAFTAILIILLWLFQTVFLDSFYRTIKTAGIKSSAEEIAKNINSNDLDSSLRALAHQNGICIIILNEDHSVLYNEEVTPGCAIHKMSSYDLNRYYSKAKENSGSTFELITNGFFARNFFEKKMTGNVPPPPFRRVVKNIVFIKIAKTNTGAERVILLSTMISPIDSTVETLRVQLIYITFILLILAILLALLISKKISKPIIKINESAKELARGNFSEVFEGKGYLEISELSDTLNFAANELSKVEALRRELIANISHDLRTPLTMITGYAEVMRDLPGENTPENVQIIIDESKRLSSLVNDILDLSKLQSGSQELVLSRFNLTSNIREILNRYSKLTEQNGYHIKFIASEDIIINADELKISQVVYNLINNAINYTGEDKSVTVCQSVRDNYVKIEVIDTGEGIPTEDLPYVWDRYYKVQKAHKRSAVGTGLGLSIIKSILNLHSADYGVISTPGQGSIFWFELEIEPDESPNE